MGVNKPKKTHPLAAKYGHRFASIHSELDAILSANEKPQVFRLCEMVNIRIAADRSIRMSKPCKYCLNLLGAFSFKRVMYTNLNGQFEQLY